MKHLTKSMHRTLAVLLALILCLSGLGLMTGCSGEPSEPCGTPEAGGIPIEDEPEPRETNPEPGQPDQTAEWVVRAGMELTPQMERVNLAVSDTSMELFRRSLVEPAAAGESAMISPFSVVTAFAMAQEGAAGITAEEMEAVFGWNAEEIASWLAAWNQSLSDKNVTKMNVVNSFWYRDGSFQPSENYLHSLESAYDAQLRPSAFDDAAVAEINRWCEEETRGMIPRVVERVDADVEALLLNASAFEGKWKKEYDAYQITENEIFIAEDGTESVVTMLTSEEDTYLEADGVTGFIKPYTDGYSLVALLPEEGNSVADLVNRMDGAYFRGMLAGAKSAQVHAVIPELKAEYNAVQMKETLQDMGLVTIFDPGAADLSGMGQTAAGSSLYVSQVIHKTFIELNREGTRAAAVTGLVTKATSAVPVELPYYEVRLDRPFVYVIMDDFSQIPLFAGVTMNVEG